MVNAEEALSSKRARDVGVVPDVIFIRNDGWSLGAPKRLESAAHRLWADEWIGFVRRPSTTAQPIGLY